MPRDVRDKRDDPRQSLALRGAEVGVWEHDLADEVVVIDARTAELLRAPGSGEMPAEAVLTNIHPEDRDDIAQALEAVLERRAESFRCDFRVVGADGGAAWRRGTGRIRRMGGRDVLFGVTFDITEERATLEELEAARSQIEITARELNHRIGNLFSIVSSLVTQSARGAASAEEAATVTRERIGALARAHELTNGLGVSDVVDLRALASAVLSPYGDHAGKITISGDPVRVDANDLTPIGLIFHELATNALKYGALSRPDGALSISWEGENGALRALRWVEAGEGMAGEAGSGFGTRLIDMSARQLGATVQRNAGRDAFRVIVTKD